MKLKSVLFWLMLLFSAFVLQAQTETPKGKKTLVSLPVAVSDREGRYISGLKKSDFTVFQDGIKQDISFFATDDEPVNVALLLDTSESTREVLPNIREAAEEFIELMNPADQCLIATFDSELKIIQPFSGNKKDLKKSLLKINTAAKEGSVVLRAVSELEANSFKNSQSRKVIVLLSDGKDFGSSVSKTDLISRLEESDVMVYSIFYQTGKGFNKIIVNPAGEVKEGKENKPKKEKKPKKSKTYSIIVPVQGDVYNETEIKLSDRTTSIEAVNFLQELSDTTAGRFYVGSAPDFSRIFKQIAGELRQQYRLGFYSKGDADSTVRNIIVKVERPNVVVRTREKLRSR